VDLFTNKPIRDEWLESLGQLMLELGYPITQHVGRGGGV